MSFDTFAQNSQYQFNQANKIGEEIADNEFRMMENQQKQQQQQFSNQLAQNAEDRNQWRFKQEQEKRKEELAQERFNQRDLNSIPELVRRVRAGEVDSLTDDQSEALLKSNILKNKIALNGFVDDSDYNIISAIRSMSEQDLKNSGMNMDYFRRFNAELAKDPNKRLRQQVEAAGQRKQLEDYKEVELLRAENFELQKQSAKLQRLLNAGKISQAEFDNAQRYIVNQMTANNNRTNLLTSQFNLEATEKNGRNIALTNAQKTIAQNKASMARSNYDANKFADELKYWEDIVSKTKEAQYKLEFEKVKNANEIYKKTGKDTELANAYAALRVAQLKAGEAETNYNNRQMLYDKLTLDGKLAYNQAVFDLANQQGVFKAMSAETQNRFKTAIKNGYVTDLAILIAQNKLKPENVKAQLSAEDAKILAQQYDQIFNAMKAESNAENFQKYGQRVVELVAQTDVFNAQNSLSASQQANKDQPTVNQTESNKKQNALTEQQILSGSLQQQKLLQEDVSATQEIINKLLSGEIKFEQAKAAIEKSGITDKTKALNAVMQAAAQKSTADNFPKVQKMAQDKIDEQYKNHQDAQSDKPILQNLINDVYNGKYTPDDALEAINNAPNIKNKDAARKAVKAVLVDSKEWRQLQEYSTVAKYLGRKYTPQQELMLKVAAGLVNVDQLTSEDRKLLTGIERGIPDYKNLVNMQTNLINDPGSYGIDPEFVRLAKGNTFWHLGSSSGKTKKGDKTSSETFTPPTPSQNTSSQKKNTDEFYDIRNYAAKTYSTDVKNITKEDAEAINKEYNRLDQKTGKRVYSQDGNGLIKAMGMVLDHRFSKYGTPPDGISPAQHNWATDLYGRYYANADDAMKKKIATMQKFYSDKEAAAAKAKEENDISKKIQLLENLDNEWKLEFKKQLGDTDAAIPPSPWELELIGFEYERAKRNRDSIETSTGTKAWTDWLKTNETLSQFAKRFGLKDVPDEISEDEWNNGGNKVAATVDGPMVVKTRPFKEVFLKQAQKIDARNPDAGAVFFVENILPKIINRRRYIAEQTALEKRAAAIENATN